MTTTYYLERGDDELELLVEYSKEGGEPARPDGRHSRCCLREPTLFLVDNVTYRGQPFDLMAEELDELYEWMEKNESKL